MDIKSVIKEKGYTMDSLAKSINKSKSSISQVANGNPTIDKIKELAAGLGCHWLEFFADELRSEGISVKRADGTDLLGGSARPTGVGMFRCPNCGSGVMLEVKIVSTSQTTSGNQGESEELPFKE